MEKETSKIKIAITGTRGIPNRYGGFEQFAEFLAPALVEKGFDVSVYCQHNHPWKENTFKGVKLLRCYDPESLSGAAGQLVYDLLCIVHARRQGFDIIYQLGYTSSGLWQFMMPEQSVLISNMDGMEWQRAKYGSWIRRFLRFSEKKVALRSDHLVGDAVPVRDYLSEKYSTPCSFIPYGATIFENPQAAVLEQWTLEPGAYFLVIARMQKDNHLEMIIDGYLQSGSTKTLIIIGNVQNKYGNFLERKYETSSGVQFKGGIFDSSFLNQLRYFSALYFHGHSAGGTNPSLLEAMACQAAICAHDNPFNRSVCVEGALYFINSAGVSEIIREMDDTQGWQYRKQYNKKRIIQQYNPARILQQYTELFIELMQTQNQKRIRNSQ